MYEKYPRKRNIGRHIKTLNKFSKDQDKKKVVIVGCGAQGLNQAEFIENAFVCKGFRV